MAEKKLSRKELKEPDAFMKAGGQIRDWLQKHTGLLIGVVAVVILGGAGVALASYVAGRGEDQASKDLGAALKVLERPINEKAPEAAAADEDEPPFKSAKEKDEATVKELSDFRGAHKNTRAAHAAALPLGDALYRLGRYDEAVSAYQEYVKQMPQTEPLRATALEGTGYAYEAKGQLDSALAAYEQLSRENKTDFERGMGQYHKGRVLILQGKKDEAAKVLTEVNAAFPQSAAARLAQDRLSLLAAEGVKLPPPPPPAVPDAGTK